MNRVEIFNLHKGYTGFSNSGTENILVHPSC